MRHILFRPLAWLTDANLADAILGDLEEIRHRKARTSLVSATVFFWWALFGTVAHIAYVRFRNVLSTFFPTSGGTRGIGGDIEHAVRSLRRNPGFAAAAVVLLALGIGANTVVFSVVQGVVLRPLPYQDPGRLVYLWSGTDTRPGNRHQILTGSHVHEIARHSSSLDGYAVTMPWDSSLNGYVDLMREDGSDRLRGAFVTPNTFDLLGVRPALGRTFTATDDEASPVAVISAGLWKRRFGGAPGVLGTHVRLAPGRASRSQPAYTIVGVLPEDVRFTYPRDTEIFLLLPWSRIKEGRALEYTMIGRLRPNVTVEQAEAEVTTLLRNVASGYTNVPAEYMPELLARTRSMVEPLQQHVSAEVRPGLTLLAAVAALVLLIACVNLGLLVLGRTVDRTRELAVRAALGAGRARILRLLTVEGMLLAVIGGIAGVTLAAMLLPVVRALLPSIVPRAGDITVNTDVLGFTALVTGLTGLVCGVVPGLIASRTDLLAPIRRSGVTSTGTRGAMLWRSSLVGLQVAVVLVLLVGAGLLLHSFWKLQWVELGFEPDELLTFETRLYNPKYRGRERLAGFERELLAHVRSLPGVESATTTTAVPMRGVDFMYVIGPVNGRPKPGHLRSVGPEYFPLMRIPLRAGRIFTEGDAATAPRVMVVSEAYARQHFGHLNPLGRRMVLDEEQVEIVGVVGDVRYAEIARNAAPAFYVPRAQSPTELICLLVKPRPGMRASVAEALRGATRAIDPEQPAEGLTTVAEIVSESTADRRFYAVATGSFAAVALVLAIAGVFGVVSRAVTERRREFAIRAAVGADSTTLLRLVVTSGLMPVALGTFTGILAAGMGAHLLEAFLFGVTPADPVSYAAASGLVLVIAAAACVGPAIRAVRAHPMAALRSE